MAKCSNAELFKLISNKALTQETEVELTLLTNLPDCKKINAKNFSAIDGTYSYDAYKTPTNRFECMRQGCINSGTLAFTGTSTNVTYHLLKDATEFAAGVITAYVLVEDVSKLPITLDVSISSEAAFTDADKYTLTLTVDMVDLVTDDEFIPIVVDLTKTPTEIGNGWTPSSTGSYIKFESTTLLDGLSSISVFDSIGDFETNDVVKLRCLSEVGGTFDIGALEATCTASGYDTDSANGGFDWTISGRLMSPNFWKLNPMYGKGSAVAGFDLATVKKTVESYTVGTAAYGRVVLADAYQDECGFFSVQMADNCNVHDASLLQLTIPTIADVDAGHYQVIKNADGTTDVIFNASHVGRDVLISYPIAAEIEEVAYSMDNVGETRVRMSYTRETSDGVKYRFVFNNVLITSFPMNIANTDDDISFTVNVQRDSDGVYMHQYRILS